MILPQQIHGRSTSLGLCVIRGKNLSLYLTADGSHCKPELAIWDLQFEGSGIYLTGDTGSLLNLRSYLHHGIIKKGGILTDLP